MYPHCLAVILRTVLTLNITPENTTMAFRDTVLANEHLRKVLTEAEIPNLEGQVVFDLNDKRGWGSFGDVYMGRFNGIVSSTTCLSAGRTELMPKFTSAERLCQGPERYRLDRRWSMGKVPSGMHTRPPTLGSSQMMDRSLTYRDSSVR